MGVYYNLFQPVLHLVSKEVMDGKVKRTWDAAQTPTVAAGVAALHATTNPRRLRQAIYAAVARLWDAETAALAAD